MKRNADAVVFAGTMTLWAAGFVIDGRYAWAAAFAAAAVLAGIVAATRPKAARTKT